MRSDGSIFIEFITSGLLHLAFWLVAGLAGWMVGLAVTLGLIEFVSVAGDGPSVVGVVIGGGVFAAVLGRLYRWRKEKKLESLE